MKTINILNGLEMNNVNFVKEKNLFFIISEILKVENCRAAEVLSADWSNFHPDRFLILKGKKKSADIIIRDRELLRLISNIPKTDAHKIFPNISYFQLYRFIKSRFGHQFNSIKTKKNKKITHAFRYINCRAIDNDEEIKLILHHKSKRSGAFYKNKLKG